MCITVRYTVSLPVELGLMKLASSTASRTSTATSGAPSSTSGAAESLVHSLVLDGAFGGLIALTGTLFGVALVF